MQHDCSYSGSAPHHEHAGDDVNARPLARGPRRGRIGRRRWPGGLFEQPEQSRRNEPCPGGVDMPVALGMLAMGEEALWYHEMEVVLGARHRNIEQAAFFLDFGRRAGAEIRWHAAVDDIEHIHRFPFLALGGMDRGQDQIVLVEQGNAGLVAGGVGWIEREFGEETFARRVSARDLFELDQIGAAAIGILMDPVEMRLAPPTPHFEGWGPGLTTDCGPPMPECPPPAAATTPRRARG